MMKCDYFVYNEFVFFFSDKLWVKLHDGVYDSYNLLIGRGRMSGKYCKMKILNHKKKKKKKKKR